MTKAVQLIRIFGNGTSGGLPELGRRHIEIRASAFDKIMPRNEHFEWLHNFG